MTETPVAPDDGETLVTTGAAAVVNDQTTLLASAVPQRARSRAGRWRRRGRVAV